MSVRSGLLDRLQHSPYGRFYRQLAQMDQEIFDELAFKRACQKKLVGLLFSLLVGGLVFVFSPQLALLILVCLIFLLLRKDLAHFKRMKKMKAEVSRAFVGYINNIIIFLEAGYGMEKALEESARLGRDNRLKRLINMAFVHISHGRDREESLKEVVVMAQNPYVSKLIFVADQGMRIGKKQVMSSLALLSEKCMREELDAMQEEAAKASSKMVFPMMLIFVAIAILAMAPGLITLFTSM